MLLTGGMTPPANATAPVGARCMCGRPSIHQSLHHAPLKAPLKAPGQVCYSVPSKMVVPRWITLMPMSESLWRVRPWPPAAESRVYVVTVLPSTSIKSLSSAPSTTVFGQPLQAILHFVLIEDSDPFPCSCRLQVVHRPQREALDGTYTGPRRLPSCRVSSTPEAEEEALLIESRAPVEPPTCARSLLWARRARRPRHSVARQLIAGAGESRWTCDELQSITHTRVRAHVWDGVDAPDLGVSHVRRTKTKRQTIVCRAVRIIAMSSEAPWRGNTGTPRRCGWGVVGGQCES